MAFVGTLSQIKLLFGPLVIHLSVGESGGYPEEVGHAPNCIMGQYYNTLQFTRSLMLFGPGNRDGILVPRGRAPLGQH